MGRAADAVESLERGRCEAIVAGFVQYIGEHWVDWLNGGSAAIVAWIAASTLGGPLLTFWSDRRAVLEVVQEHGLVGFHAADDRIRDARASLRSAASKMGFYAQGGPLIVRLYCWFLCYDVAFAMRALNGLHDLTGEGTVSEQQTNNADAVRLFLGATRLLSTQRKKELRRMVRQAAQLP